MHLRPATTDDAEPIGAIYNDAIAHSTAILWHEPKPVSLWRDRLTDRPARYPVIVATEEAGGVVGFAALGPYDDKCGYDAVAELSVYLVEHVRGQGLGRRLSEAVIKEGRAAGLRHVLSRVTAGNDASFRLHDELGFRHAGTLEQLGEKFGQRHDVLLYQLRLAE
ncbi:MAG: N-acetyltransferase family protein [Planctomycetota bacterium]